MLQRFIGRVELGIIPHIVDTLIFIRYGEIEKVYELKLTVKIPAGMTDEDLTRPVIEIRDFETDKLEYEIYTFGNENVVIPLMELEIKHTQEAKIAEQKIFDEIRRYDPLVEVELTSRGATIRVDKKVIPRLIGKDGSNIIKLERKLGVKLDVQPSRFTVEKESKFEIQETKSALCFIFNREIVGKTAEIYADDNFIMQAIIGKKAQIRVDKRSSRGETLIKALDERKSIKISVK